MAANKKAAFEAAVKHTMSIMTGKANTNSAKLTKLAQAYADAAGITRQIADRQIAAEANRRLGR